MMYIKVHVDGSGCWPDLIALATSGNLLHISDSQSKIKIAGLEGGLKSGKPSVAIRIDVSGSATIIAETSLALFLTAADMLKEKHGDPRID